MRTLLIMTVMMMTAATNQAFAIEKESASAQILLMNETGQILRVVQPNTSRVAKVVDLLRDSENEDNEQNLFSRLCFRGDVKGVCEFIETIVERENQVSEKRSNDPYRVENCHQSEDALTRKPNQSVAFRIVSPSGKVFPIAGIDGCNQK